MDGELEQITGPDGETEADTWGRVFVNAESSPEKVLCAAVLAQAIEDTRRELPVKERDWRAQALYWIESDSQAIMAFESICEALGLEPDAVRRRLLNGRNRE